MATPPHLLVQDQNSSFLYNGANPCVKTYATAKPDRKRGVVGARRALNDISNSTKPSLFQATMKEASKKAAYSVEKDVTVISKSKISKASEKGNTGGRRKPLVDLTNSAKPTLDQVSKVVGKLNVIAEEKEKIPSRVFEERFRHNHQEYIKAQRIAADVDYFLESVGLINGTCLQLSSVSPPKRGFCDSSDEAERDKRLVRMTEIPEALLFDDHQTPWSKFSGQSSPICCSPKTPYLNCEDVDLSDLLVIDFT